jgi:hypothetical protein
MIRNVKDVTDLFDRRFGSAMARPLSVVRTLVWALLGMYLFGLVVPAPPVHFAHNRALATVPAKDLILNKNDPRGWQQVKRDPHTFTIAWIGGSTIQTVKPGQGGFLPVDVLNRLQQIDGKPVQVNMYLMEASRIFDLYAAMANALASKPDMVILDLNPLWIFNPNAVQEWENFNPAAFPDLISRTGNWPLMGALYSPRDVALSLASSHLSSIRDRWSYSQRLLDATKRLSPLTEPPAVAPVSGQPRPTGVQLIASMEMPYSFWNYYRLAPQDTNGLRGYPAILRQSKTGGSTMNDDIVAQLLSALGDSKIPAIAYVSAVGPATLDPATDAALHGVESHLRQIAAEHPARTLFVQWQSGTRLVQGLQFRDMAHMTFDPPIANLMAATICSQLTAVDPQTQCTATSRTEP